MKLFSTIALLLLGIISIPTYANHLLGGSISYQFYGQDGAQQRYRIFLYLYADCANNTPNSGYALLLQGNPEIKVYKGNNTYSSTRLRCILDSSNIEISNICIDDMGQSNCNNINNPIPGIKQFVYSGIIVLDSKHSDWRFSFEGNVSPDGQNQNFAGRSFLIQNAVIHNPINNAATNIHLSATLNNTMGYNNTAQILRPPNAFYCLHQEANYSIPVQDPDLDEIKVKLIPGQFLDPAYPNLGVQELTYISPYMAQKPVPYSGVDFRFDTTTGQMIFKPDLAKNCVVVNTIEEYRNGIKVGSSMREMTLFILDNCNNNAPIANVDTDVIHGTVLNSGNETFMVSVCEGQSLPLSFTIAVKDPEQDNIGISYSNLPRGASVTLIDNNSPMALVNIHWLPTEAAPGKYYIHLTFSDDHCPLKGIKTITYTIIVQPHPVSFWASISPTCIGASVGQAAFIPIGTHVQYHYQWYNAENNIIRDVHSQQGDTISGLSTGQYYVKANNPNGCGKSIVFNIDTISWPQALLPLDTTVCEGMPLVISNLIQDSNYHYQWQDGDTTCCYEIKEEGRYVLHVSNACATVSDTIFVSNTECEYCFFIPNAFTPNNDGMNDVFKILVTCPIEDYEVKIYNRLGQKVFNSYLPHLTWDGTYMGKPEPVGVYHYIVSAKNKNDSGARIIKKGDITLIR
jgi:gliding motility-associated-like protein